eukprot:4343801-Pleurochrysis_carterae.AAC.6
MEACGGCSAHRRCKKSVARGLGQPRERYEDQINILGIPMKIQHTMALLARCSKGGRKQARYRTRFARSRGHHFQRMPATTYACIIRMLETIVFRRVCPCSRPSRSRIDSFLAFCCVPVVASRGAMLRRRGRLEDKLRQGGPHAAEATGFAARGSMQ